MSVEALPGASGAPQEELRFDPNMDLLEQSRRLREDVVQPINSGLNEQIGYGLQSEEAGKLVSPLIETQNLALLSEEVQQYTTGVIEIGDLSDEAKQAIEQGATASSLLEAAYSSRDKHVAAKLETESQLNFDEVLDEARTDYVQSLMNRPMLKGRKAHKATLAEAEQTYNDALLNKIAQVMDMDPNHRKAPYSPATGVEFSKENPTAENLSDNQLHLLVDQLSREQLNKAKEIESLSNRGVKRVLGALKNSRGLRIAVGGAIWAGSTVAASKGLLPEGAQFLGEGADAVLPLIAGYFTSREVFGGVDEGLAKLKSSRQLKRDISELSNSTLLTERAIRTVYSGVEYQDGLIKTRRAGETEDDNKQAFSNINSEFGKLQRENYRGGKPYTAEQVLPYVADLYLRRKGQVDAIVTSEDPKEAFLQLCGEVIAADTKELTDRQQANRAKRAAFRALSVCTTAFAGQWMSQIRDVQTMTSRPTGMIAVEAR